MPLPQETPLTAQEATALLARATEEMINALHAAAQPRPEEEGGIESHRYLDRIQASLALRQQAMEAGAMPTAEIVAAGELAMERLRGVIRTLDMECSRLTQIQAGFRSTPVSPQLLDFHG